MPWYAKALVIPRIQLNGRRGHDSSIAFCSTLARRAVLCLFSCDEPPAAEKVQLPHLKVKGIGFVHFSFERPECRKDCPHPPARQANVLPRQSSHRKNWERDWTPRYVCMTMMPVFPMAALSTYRHVFSLPPPLSSSPQPQAPRAFLCSLLGTHVLPVSLPIGV